MAKKAVKKPARSSVTERKSGSFRLVWRAKGLANGTRSIRDMAKALRDEATRLDKMADDGVLLNDTVDNDYAMLLTDDPKVAKKYGIPRDAMFD